MKKCRKTHTHRTEEEAKAHLDHLYFKYKYTGGKVYWCEKHKGYHVGRLHTSEQNSSFASTNSGSDGSVPASVRASG